MKPVLANEPQPALPVEIVTMVLEQVPRETLLAALRVNSTWYSSALPLLYTHLWFDPKGPRPGEIRPEYLSKVKILDIYNHGPGDCAGMDFKGSPEVIRLHFRFNLDLIRKGHRGKKCPLLELEPRTVVFLDFDGEKRLSHTADISHIQVYPNTTERVLVWNVANGFKPSGYGEVKDIIFPRQHGEQSLWALVNLLEAEELLLEEVMTEPPRRDEIVIFANNNEVPVQDWNGNNFDLIEWFDQWVSEHVPKLHTVVNLRAFNPYSVSHEQTAYGILHSFMDACEQIATDYIPLVDDDCLEFKYHMLQPAISTALYLDPNRPQIETYLTEKEINALLPREAGLRPLWKPRVP